MKKKVVLRNIFPSISFLGSRASGEKIRNLIDDALKEGKVIILDFDGIEGITQSFGDEIIGIFTRAFGKDFIKKNIKAINYNDEIKVVLNWVVNYSSQPPRHK